jgi:hypothetical protein
MGTDFPLKEKSRFSGTLRLEKISKHLNILRKLKYRLSRTNLDKLYLVYIRPLFEYACELWDNCVIGNSQKLEQLQLEAARIVTGLPIVTKTDILYRETGGTDFPLKEKSRFSGTLRLEKIMISVLSGLFLFPCFLYLQISEFL